MPFNGTGVFNRIYQWVNDRTNGIDVDADRMDLDSNDIAQGLSNCITRDGQSPAFANLPMGGKKLTNLGTGSSNTDSVNYGQVFNSPAFITPSATTSPSSSDNSLRLATTAMVQQVAFNAALPVQTGYSILTTDGASASWAADQTGNADKLLTTSGTGLSWTGNLKTGVIRFVDTTDATKKIAFDASGLTTATTRTVTVPDRDVTLGGFCNLVVMTTTGTWTCPSGITRAKVTVVNGGSAGNNVDNSDGARGGDAGISVVPVVPGGAYARTVGAGGAVPLGSGGVSSFSGPGITTITPSSAQLFIPGGSGLPAFGTGDGLGGGSYLSGVNGVVFGGYGAGGRGNGYESGHAGVVIIEY